MAFPATTHRPTHLLRLIISCRKITAQVTNPTTNTIIAMASSSEQEFQIKYKAKLNSFPRSYLFWDSKTASVIGEKLAVRVSEIGLSSVRIDVKEEVSKPVYFRKMLGPFFDSLKRGGIVVDGADELPFLG